MTRQKSDPANWAHTDGQAQADYQEELIMTEEREFQEVQPGHAPLLTAEQLYSAQISTRPMGYSKVQVDMLLEEAAATIESLRLEKEGLAATAAALEQELHKYREMESSLRASLLSSQKMGESMIASAKLQADALVEEARIAKERAVFKMEQLTPALQGEIQRLTAARDQLRQDLSAILKAHEALIETIPRAETKEQAASSEKNAAAEKSKTGKNKTKTSAGSSVAAGQDGENSREEDNAYIDL
ncbi:MAG TPA: DivIVA domain-containing protein [Candidatus Hydrogenedentes bacterium]|nr:DivIVA domain-containing protein [Candidatus Hydrogenedentota bacterium]HPX86441.1 DivIVA domain-containing protein [Candidatus Hydrogenedentota bacterium]